MRRLSGHRRGWGMRMVQSVQEDEEAERERRELWNFSVHSCGIDLRSWKMYKSDFSCCWYSPHRGPGDGDFSNRAPVRSLSISTPRFSAFPFSFSISLCLIMLIETDTAMWTLRVILESTCLADKSVANWNITWEPASPSRLNVPSQKAVAFDIISKYQVSANLNHYVTYVHSWHDTSTLGQTHSFMFRNDSGIL